MGCQRCGSDRVPKIYAKCNDLFNAELGDEEIDDHVPSDMGIGSGDYVRMHYCLDCGQIQGTFPLPPTQLETGEEVDEDDEDIDVGGDDEY